MRGVVGKSGERRMWKRVQEDGDPRHDKVKDAKVDVFEDGNNGCAGNQESSLSFLGCALWYNAAGTRGFKKRERRDLEVGT
jgi:hypothetical protein